MKKDEPTAEPVVALPIEIHTDKSEKVEAASDDELSLIFEEKSNED